MALDAATTDLNQPASGPERIGVFTLFVDIIRRPSAAMARIAERPKKRWVVPLVLLTVVSTIVAVAYAPRAMEAGRADLEALQERQLEGMDPEQSEAIAAAQQSVGAVQVGVAGVGAVVGTIIGALIGAAVLHFLATVMGGQQAFLEVFSTTAWAKVPLILRELVRMPWLIMGGFDPNPVGLAGLASSGGLTEGRSYFEPLLAQVEVWTIWYFVLLVIAVRASAKLTRGRAIAVVGLLVVAKLALGMAGIAMGNAMTQLFS